MSQAPAPAQNSVIRTNLPVPDPTVLTTAQLVRETAALREILEEKISSVMQILQARFTETIVLREVLEQRILALREVTQTRFEDHDKALQLIEDASHRQPSDVDIKVGNLQKVHEEKFESIQTQFRERDTRTEQTSKDSKVAVDAALQAAKEAVGEQNKSSGLAISKSEASTNKQIDQLQLLIQSSGKATDDKIDDLKQRLTRIESEGRGMKAAEVTQQTSNTSMVSIVGLIIGTLVGIGGIVVGLVFHAR